MVIFVCGISGSGKTFFAKQLANTLNFKYVSVDEIGHKIYENDILMKKVYSLFGDEINNENGVFDRKKLGRIVFGETNSKRVEIFNKITWKYMKELIEKEIENNCVIDYFMLPKIKIKDSCTKILIKPINEDLRIKKIIERDNLPEDYVKLRNNACPDIDEKDFDFVFTNDYTQKTLENNIHKIIEFLNKKTH